MVKLGVESVVLSKSDSSQDNSVQLLQAQSTIISDNGSPLKTDKADYYDYIPSIPYSLYDKRQTITYAIDIMNDSSALQDLIDHEIAFGRAQISKKSIQQIISEYNKNWEQFNALQISYFSKTKDASCFELFLSPIVSILDISAVQEIIKFFTPKSSKSSKKSKEKTKEEQKNIENRNLFKQKVIGKWKDSPPLKISKLKRKQRIKFYFLGFNFFFM